MLRCVVQVKSQIIGEQTLTLYDPNKTLIIATDKFPQGWRQVFLTDIYDGTEKPIAFATGFLTQTER